MNKSCAPHIRLINMNMAEYRLRKLSISLSARSSAFARICEVCSFSFLSAASCISFSFLPIFLSLSDTAVSRLLTLCSRLSTDTLLSFKVLSALSFFFLCSSALFFNSLACFSCKSLSLLVTLCSVSCCTCNRSC